MRDKVVPLVPILWRRNDRLVPERMNDGLRGKFPRHEAQFDEGADMIFQQAIIDLIDVREIIDGFSGGIFIVHAGLVVENRVKTDVFESGHLLDLAEVPAIAISQRKNRAS